MKGSLISSSDYERVDHKDQSSWTFLENSVRSCNGTSNRFNTISISHRLPSTRRMDGTQFVGDVPTSLVCSICYLVMLNPHSCRQGHQFCKTCIEMSMVCPTCNCIGGLGGLGRDDLTKLRVAEDFINDLFVYCRHRHPSTQPLLLRDPTQLKNSSSQPDLSSGSQERTGCPWVGTLANQDIHLQNDCNFALCKCTYSDCNISAARLNLKEHMENCEHKETDCSQCNESVKESQLANHAPHCNGVEIACPHECGKILLRGGLVKHEKVCDNVSTTCSFMEYGCEVRAKRRKMKEHEELKLKDHVRLLSKQLTHLKRNSEHRQINYGQTRIKWTINHFRAKAEQRILTSKIVGFRARYGQLYLKLKLTVAQFIGLFVVLDAGDNRDLPLSLEGSKLLVKNGSKEAVLRFHSGDLLRSVSSHEGSISFLQMDPNISRVALDDPEFRLNDLENGARHVSNDEREDEDEDEDEDDEVEEEWDTEDEGQRDQDENLHGSDLDSERHDVEAAGTAAGDTNNRRHQTTAVTASAETEGNRPQTGHDLADFLQGDTLTIYGTLIVSDKAGAFHAL